MNKSILWVVGPFFLLSSGCWEDRSPSPNPPSAQHDCASKTVSDGKCFYILPNAPNGKVFYGSFTEDIAIRTQGVTVGKGQWKCHNNSWKPIYQYRCLFCSPAPDLSVESCKSSLDALIRSF